MRGWTTMSQSPSRSRSSTRPSSGGRSRGPRSGELFLFGTASVELPLPTVNGLSPALLLEPGSNVLLLDRMRQLATQFVVALQPRGVEPAVGDSLTDRTVRLAVVGAVSKPAVGRERFDVVEDSAEPLIADPQ